MVTFRYEGDPFHTGLNISWGWTKNSKWITLVWGKYYSPTHTFTKTGFRLGWRFGRPFYTDWGSSFNVIKNYLTIHDLCVHTKTQWEDMQSYFKTKEEKEYHEPIKIQ